MTRRSLFSAITLFVCLALPRPALAHLGPPFPILVDQQIPGYSVTVLANPDVGQAVVIAVLEPRTPGIVGSISGVDIWVQPLSGRLPKSVYHAKLESARGRLQFQARPDIDAVETWKLGVDIHAADGRNFPLVAQVESTPPGIGPWGLLFFLFPFILFGGLWCIVFIRRSRTSALRRVTPQPLSKVTPASTRDGIGERS